MILKATFFTRILKSDIEQLREVAGINALFLRTFFIILCHGPFLLRNLMTLCYTVLEKRNPNTIYTQYFTPAFFCMKLRLHTTLLVRISANGKTTRIMPHQSYLQVLDSSSPHAHLREPQ